MSSDDITADLSQAVDERLAARREEAVRRAKNLRQLRAQRQAARDAGLRARHAAKLARTRPTSTTETLVDSTAPTQAVPTTPLSPAWEIAVRQLTGDGWHIASIVDHRVGRTTAEMPQPVVMLEGTTPCGAVFSLACGWSDLDITVASDGRSWPLGVKIRGDERAAERLTPGDIAEHLTRNYSWWLSNKATARTTRPRAATVQASAAVPANWIPALAPLLAAGWTVDQVTGSATAPPIRITGAVPGGTPFELTAQWKTVTVLFRPGGGDAQTVARAISGDDHAAMRLGPYGLVSVLTAAYNQRRHHLPAPRLAT